MNLKFQAKLYRGIRHMFILMKDDELHLDVDTITRDVLDNKYDKDYVLDNLKKMGFSYRPAVFKRGQFINMSETEFIKNNSPDTIKTATFSVVQKGEKEHLEATASLNADPDMKVFEVLGILNDMIEQTVARVFSRFPEGNKEITFGELSNCWPKELRGKHIVP